MLMKNMGIAVIIIWATIIYTLHPLPTREFSIYQSFLYEETEAYVETLSEIEKTEYFNDKEFFLQSRLEEGKMYIWTTWVLKFIFIALGLFAGYLICIGKRSRLLIFTTSFAYLYAWVVKLLEMMPEGLSLLAGYSKLMQDGVIIGKHSIVYQLFFYHQFLILPILHIGLLVLCLYWVYIEMKK